MAVSAFCWLFISLLERSGEVLLSILPVLSFVLKSMLLVHLYSVSHRTLGISTNHSPFQEEETKKPEKCGLHLSTSHRRIDSFLDTPDAFHLLGCQGACQVRRRDWPGNTVGVGQPPFPPDRSLHRSMDRLSFKDDQQNLQPLRTWRSGQLYGDNAEGQLCIVVGGCGPQSPVPLSL